MQNTASVDSASSGSSIESLTKQKFKCPLGKEPLPERPPSGKILELTCLGPEEFCTLFDGADGKEPQALVELSIVKEELEALSESGEARIQVLQARLSLLQDWIQDAFGVDDIDAWEERQMQEEKEKEKEREHESGTTKLGSGKHNLGKTPAKSNSNVAAGEEGSGSRSNGASDDIKPIVPPLRIKLVDDKLRATVGNGGTSSQTAARGGTGSKNLSRMMSKPNELSTEVRSKVANQTPINIFWNYVDPYFKTLDDGDVRNLDDVTKYIDPTPFIIPPLGKHYEDQWREKYGYDCHVRSMRRRVHSASTPTGEYFDRNGNHTNLRVSSVRERLLAMLIEENLTVPEASESGSNDSLNGELENIPEAISSPPPESVIKTDIDFIHADERIKKELAEAGLHMFVPKVDYQEDDGICSEIRILQRQLKEQVCVNHYRKRKLAELVRSKLPAQEFFILLNEIDKQIEQSFAKRSRQQKKKKKGSSSTSSPSPAPSGGEDVSLVETRKKLLTAFSDIIPSQKEFLSANPRSLYDPAVEEQVLQFARKSGSWIPLPEQPLQYIKLSTNAAHPVFPCMKENGV